jgi:hypothetical protein
MRLLADPALHRGKADTADAYGLMRVFGRNPDRATLARSTPLDQLKHWIGLATGTSPLARW